MRFIVTKPPEVGKQQKFNPVAFPLLVGLSLYFLPYNVFNIIVHMSDSVIIGLFGINAKGPYAVLDCVLRAVIVVVIACRQSSWPQISSQKLHALAYICT